MINFLLLLHILFIPQPMGLKDLIVNSLHILITQNHFIVKYGTIVKAAVIKADRKEVKGGDHLLVIQYRNQLVVKSFFKQFFFALD
jgi:hypothetical protein